MGTFTQKWSRKQKDAITSACIDRGMRQRAVAELAKTGQLIPTGLDEPLAPFDMPLGTIASYVKDERKRRLGHGKRRVEDLPARDGVEYLRVRLVRAADVMLDRIDRYQADVKRDLEPALLREAARAVREIQAIPGRNEAATRKPGSKEGGNRTEGDTRHGLAAQILQDVNRTTTPPTHTDTPETPHAPEAHTAQRSEHARTQDVEHAQQHVESGSLGSAVATTNGRHQ